MATNFNHRCYLLQQIDNTVNKVYLLVYEDVMMFKKIMGISAKQGRKFYCTTVFTNDMFTYFRALHNHELLCQKYNILCHH